MPSRRNPATFCIFVAFFIIITLYMINLYMYSELKRNYSSEFQKLHQQVDQLHQKIQQDEIQISSLNNRINSRLEKIQEVKDTETSSHQNDETHILSNNPSKPVPSFKIPNPRDSDLWWQSRPSKSDHLIVFAISTLPRVDSQGNPLYYLKDTCESLLKQLEYFETIFRNSPHSLKVYVQNSEATKPHLVFDELSRDPKFSKFFIFKKVEEKKHDPYQDIPGHDYTHPRNVIPGHKARQQSSDVISLEENIFKALNYEYFVYLEDDFLTCNEAVVELIRSIAVLEKSFPNFCGLRMSYGMNAIMLPRDTARAYSIYLEKHLKELPIDDLFHRFTKTRGEDLEDRKTMCAPNGRLLFNYKNIKWEHIGDISTFSERNKAGFRSQFPRCEQVSVEMHQRCFSSPDLLDPC